MPVLTANGARAAVVLVVEDEFLIRCNIADHLRQAGYTVVEAASGEEAVAICKADMSIDIVSPTSISSGRRAAGMWLSVFALIARMSQCFILRGNRLTVDVAFRAVLFSPSHIGTTMS